MVSFRIYKKHKMRAGLFTLLAATILALIIAESLVRILAPEWRVLTRALPTMDQELATHEPDPDPRLLARLKPSSVGDYRQDFGPFRVTVNSLGFRGPERTRQKPPGTFRIVCIGGSNVYGAGLNDDQTWPAQLEQRLNREGPVPYEVFNLGVSGYNALQMTVSARQAIEKFNPDLVLFAFSNVGPRFFLKDTPDVAGYFDRDPTLWLEILPPELIAHPTWMSQSAKLALLTHFHLYRFWLVSLMARHQNQQPMITAGLSPYYLETTRQFLSTMPARVPIAVFICPAVNPPDMFERFYAGLNLPVFVLRADDLHEEYRRFHPPAHVTAWYAENLATWLKEKNLLPASKTP